jgi:mRNA interferase MazF
MNPSRGEIWLVDLDPSRGHEQGGKRPAVVLSVDAFNHGPAGLVVVVPVTTRDKRIRSHVRVPPSATGFREESFIKCEEIRCVSKERLQRLLGTVDPLRLDEVGRIVSTLLRLC